jgi:hypothetical protein
MRETDPDDDYQTSSLNTVTKIVRSAARFTYHVSRISYNSPFSRGLEVQLQEVDAVTGEASGNNVVDELGLVELKLAEGKMCGPYCLVLHNNNNVPVWPFIFICEPTRFTILPWYMPHPAIPEAPLLPGKKHLVGCGNEDGLLFRWQKNRKTDITYIKIFVTTERTRFSSMMQQHMSIIEGRLRELSSPGSFSTEPSEVTSNSQQSIHEAEEVPQAMNLGRGSKWAAMRITIKRSYEKVNDEHHSTDSDSDS